MATFENPYGLFFPIHLDVGAPIPPGLEDSIDSSLRIILSWPYSKRHFNFTFGSVLYQLVSSPNTPTMLASIEQYVIKAIERGETRIELQNVELIQNDSGDALEINIEALILQTQTIYTYTTQI
jgi:phage baseplate assembly protein W